MSKKKPFRGKENLQDIIHKKKLELIKNESNKKFYFNCIIQELVEKNNDLNFILILEEKNILGEIQIKDYNPSNFFEESKRNILNKIRMIYEELNKYYRSYFSILQTKKIDVVKNIRLIRNSDEHFIERIYGLNHKGEEIKIEKYNKFGIYVENGENINFKNVKVNMDDKVYTLATTSNGITDVEITEDLLKDIMREIAQNLSHIKTET